MAAELTNVRVRDIPGVLVTAGRLVAQHWPALLTLALLGVAVRGSVIWLAVPVSEHSGFAAQLLLILSPLGYLLPIIAMLYLFRASLPGVAALARQEGPEASTEHRERRLVDVAVSVLVPFLAVYVSAGFVEDDRLAVINAIAGDQHQDSPLVAFGYQEAGPSLAERVGTYAWPTVVVIVAVAWVLRWALGRFERKSGFLLLAFVGALVEVYWTTQVARKVTGLQETAREWVEDRRATHTVVSGYERLVDDLGWLSRPAAAAGDWFLGLFGSLDTVIIVPIAWLTVGAVVLGHKLNPPRPQLEASERWSRVPPRARSVAASLTDDLRERWSAFWGGLRLLASAGLAPMLMFCLSFLLVLRLPDLLALAARQLWGPTEYATWTAFQPMEAGLALALSMVVTAALLAAAVEWLVAPQVAEQEAEAVSRSVAG